MKTSNLKVGGIINPAEPSIKNTCETPQKNKENFEPPSLSEIKPVDDTIGEFEIKPHDKNLPSFLKNDNQTNIPQIKEENTEQKAAKETDQPLKKKLPPQAIVKREAPSFLKKPESKKEEKKEQAKVFESFDNFKLVEKSGVQNNRNNETFISGKSSNKSMDLSMIMNQLKDKDAPKQQTKRMYLGGAKKD